MSTHLKRFLLSAFFLLISHVGYAGSATWNLNPVDNNWSNAANWTPGTVPNGESDVASFGNSNLTGVNLGLTQTGDAGYDLAEAVFEPGSSAYTITMTAVHGQTSFLAFKGAGITNNSGIVQNFVAAKSGPTLLSESGRIYFENSSSVGENVVITNQASEAGIPYGAFTSFDDSSTAASATVINEGAAVGGTMWGGFTDLLFYSNAEAATFINNPGEALGAAAGHTLVQIYAPGSVGRSTFINNGANVAGAEGGWTEIDGTISAGASFIAKGATVADAQGGQVYTYGGDGYSIFTAEGGIGSNAQGGLIDVWYVPVSSQTMLIAKGGANGGLGGTILIEGAPVLDKAQFQIFGNGVLDLSNATSSEIVIGSLAGDGVISIAGRSFVIGSNNLSTTFSGAIHDENGFFGSLTKVGNGTLTLSNGNPYNGGTVIRRGTLLATNLIGSATGAAAVQVKGGSLGGTGRISGPVIVGNKKTPSFLAPGIGKTPGTLVLDSGLTFNSLGTYQVDLNTTRVKADLVVADYVIINSGALISLNDLGHGVLAAGTLLTVIKAAPFNISGTFSNLPDGGTITVGSNTFQANYMANNGHDLTLTVVP